MKNKLALSTKILGIIAAVSLCFTVIFSLSTVAANSKAMLDENGIYNTKDDVALYIHQYNKLPSNYISKTKANELGYHGGDTSMLPETAAIGGETMRFGGSIISLPNEPGCIYKECDVNSFGLKERNAERLIYSNTGNVYYTNDHYKTFKKLY